MCFGSDAATCPNNNLYRIIGVFGSEIKLIKSTSFGNYAWDSENNIWNSSTKPDIRSTLNTTFLGTLSSTWQSKIATHSWKVGGMSYSNGSSTPRTVYNYEVGSYSVNTTDNMKIGLMYVSDHGYTASPSFWTTNMSSYSNTSNWTTLSGCANWTITRRSDSFSSTDSAFLISSNSVVGVSVVNADYICICPTFYLNSNVTYVSGSGTQSDPIRIN